MSLVTVSIVSHGHGALLPRLLTDLARCPEVGRVVVTRNIPEPDVDLPGGPLILHNRVPNGFGANHNKAFQHVETPFFAVLNPDIRLDGNPFPILLSCLEDEQTAVCVPAVVNRNGQLEDSARRFPSLFGLSLKALGVDDGRLQYQAGDPPSFAPWVAGMFLLICSADYAAVSGFDENFFLYYEDVDLCVRLWRSGRRVKVCPQAVVVHDARRASRRDPKHMAWHLASMARYFLKHAGRLPRKK